MHDRVVAIVETRVRGRIRPRGRPAVADRGHERERHDHDGAAGDDDQVIVRQIGPLS